MKLLDFINDLKKITNNGINDIELYSKRLTSSFVFPIHAIKIYATPSNIEVTLVAGGFIHKTPITANYAIKVLSDVLESDESGQISIFIDEGAPKRKRYINNDKKIGYFRKYPYTGFVIITGSKVKE